MKRLGGSTWPCLVSVVRKAVWVSSGSYRLHSLLFLIHARVLAAQIAVSSGALSVFLASVVPQSGPYRVLQAGLGALLFVGLFFVFWTWPHVLASSAGLEISRGKSRRIVPWDQVSDLRAKPWFPARLWWYPKKWQVDFVTGESFSFVGVRQAQVIVQAFWSTHRCG